ncbi:putative aquaporin 4 [Lactarius hengduanensis]|nr:putative aquaporin 4 [Lactarius hengduanensis]
MRRPFWFPTWLSRKVDERPEVNRNEGLPTNHKDERLRSPQATSHTRYPNQWAKIRSCISTTSLLPANIRRLRENIGSPRGTSRHDDSHPRWNWCNCQFALSADVNISPSPQGSYLGFNVAWAAVCYALDCRSGCMGLWGVSGGHINPAVTLCMAIFRGLPWSKAFTYILGQITGAWIGALIVFANYSGGIDIFEGGAGQRTLKTARLFSTYPVCTLFFPICFFSQSFIGAFILVFVVFAISDKHNTALHPSLVPLVIFFVILCIGAAFGMQTGYAINPARDLGPRIMTAMVGYGSQVFTFRNHYWIWGPIIASCCGGLVAGLLYDLFIYRGPESFINRP